MTEVPDPQREEKIIEGCEVYAHAPQRTAQRERTISLDELTGVQALERKHPDLPMQPGHVFRREFEYLRHGTLSWFINFDVVSGQVIEPSFGPTRTEEELPHIVSLGAQKCFTLFTLRLQKRGDFEIDQTYFHRLVAKAILFRQAEKIVAMQKFGGYRANIVTYSLAYISHHSAGRIDLDSIWQQQNIGQELRDSVQKVSHRVHEIIISPPGGKNVTEWCKREACWIRVRDLMIELPAICDDELLFANTEEITGGIENPDHADQELVAQAASIPAETWYQLSAWARETQNLHSWQRGLAFSIGRVRQNGKTPSRKQALQGLLILQEACRLGFKAESTVRAD